MPMAPAPGLHEATHGWPGCRQTLGMSGAVTRRPASFSGFSGRFALCCRDRELMLLATSAAPDTPQE